MNDLQISRQDYSPYIDGLSQENSDEFNNCLQMFVQYRNQAATALSLMVIYFGKMHEILGAERFTQLCEKILDIKRASRYRWLTAYQRAKRNLSDANGNFDLITLQRLSIPGLLLLKEDDPIIIEAIKQEYPGTAPIATSDIQRIIEDAKARIAESEAKAEKALADKQDAERRAERSIRDANAIQEKLDHANMTIEKNNLEYKTNLNRLSEKLVNENESRIEAMENNESLKRELEYLQENPKVVQVEVEVERVPAQYSSLEEAINMKTNTLNAVTRDIEDNEVRASELINQIEESEDRLAALRQEISDLSEERGSIESLFKQLDSLIAGWPHTLLKSVDKSNRILSRRLNAYGKTLADLARQLESGY